jgi:uncharacterized cupredoxin-like copper-binding protein
MRRAALLLSAIGTAATLAIVPAQGAHAGAPARVQVVEKEYFLTLSRLHVPSGKLILQVVNFGMDNHDLVVQSKSGKTWKFDVLAPQAHATKTMTLTPGKYTLSCSLPGHRGLGMVATLTVTG